jgi:hypothetical protein
MPILCWAAKNSLRGTGVELDMMSSPSVKNPQKIYKKGIKNCHRLSMYTTDVYYRC